MPSGEAIAASPPRTREELRVWVSEHLRVHIADTALIDGHDAPLDYLAHSFFEGRDSWSATPPAGTPDASAHSTPPAAPVDCVVWANRGGGKTLLGAIATLLDLVYKPGIEIRILGGSLEQSRRMFAHLRRFLAPKGDPALASLVEGKLSRHSVRLNNGSEVEVLAQSETSVRGTRVQKLRCDEVELFDRDVWEAAQLVTRSKDCDGVHVAGSVECLSTMHVPYGLMHTLIQECHAGTRRLFRWGVVDTLGSCEPQRPCRGPAPSANAALLAPAPGVVSLPQLDPGDSPRPGDCMLWPECRGRAKSRAGLHGHIPITDAITMKSRVSRATWASEMLCLRPRRTDAVFPEFDAGEHVFSADLPHAGPDRWLAGMDFGFRAPTVVVYGCVDAEGALWIVDERAESGVLLAEHIDAIKTGRGRRADSWPAPAWVGVDPSGKAHQEQTGTSNVEIMRRAGIVVKYNSLKVDAGLELIRARLRPAGEGCRPSLFVHERCAKLIESLERYRYPPNDPESTTPLKGEGFDHAVDALRYLVGNLDKPYRTASASYIAPRRKPR